MVSIKLESDLDDCAFVLTETKYVEHIFWTIQWCWRFGAINLKKLFAASVFLFGKLFIANFLEITCFEQLINFVSTEAKTDKVFAKFVPDGCDIYVGIQFVCIDTEVKCMHYEKKKLFLTSKLKNRLDYIAKNISKTP